MIYEFTPTQDLHGYAEPWAPGAGVNRLPPLAAVTETKNGVTFTSDRNGRYTLKGISTATASFTYNFPEGLGLITEVGDYWHLLNSEAAGTSTFALVGSTYIAMTPANRIWAMTDTYAGSEITGLNFYIGNGVTIDMTITPMVCKTGTAMPFAPYENICPPEGYNIWDPSQDQMIQVYAGYVNANTRELYLRPVYEEYAGEELVGPWMSSLDEYSEDATPTEGAFVIDFGGELESFEITPFMLQTLLDSLGIRQHFTDGAGLLNKLMDQAQGRVRSEEELLHLSRPLNVIAIGDQLPAGITFKPISKDVLPGLPGKFIR